MIRSCFWYMRKRKLGACTGKEYMSDRGKAMSNGSVYLDLDLVAVGVANEGGKPFPPGAAVDFGLSRFKPFALERGDDVINA